MDLDRLVDAVTREIMKRLEASGDACDSGKVLAVDCDPAGLLAEGCQAVKAAKGTPPGDCGAVLLSAGYYAQLCGCASPAAPAPGGACCCGGSIDLTGKHLVSERHFKDKNVGAGDEVLVDKNAIVTALAVDYAKGRGAKIVRR